MSLDEEIESSAVSMSLFGILENRKDSVSISEIWALMKEGCVHLKSIFEEKLLVGSFDINDIMLDSNGNIKIHFIKPFQFNADNQSNQIKLLVINLAESMLFIIDRYTVIESDQYLYQYLTDLITRMSDENLIFDGEILRLIELDADRELNGPSVDILTSDLFSSKDIDELNSDFQDSFLSTEYSLATDHDTDSDPSICVTKDNDTFSPGSFENKEKSNKMQAYLSLSQLWEYCLSPIIGNDQECLILIYTLLREVSNMLLNEVHLRQCLCLNKENILLNDKGKILLQFANYLCRECNEERYSMKYYDLKYINVFGRMLYQIVSKDQRIILSNHVILMLQRMCTTNDLIINDVLHFCRSQQAFHGTNPRNALAQMYISWSNWWSRHLQSLLRLKHSYLYDIAACHPKENVIKRLHSPINLDHHPSHYPMNVKDLFLQNPSFMTHLSHVTKVSKQSVKVQNNTTKYVNNSSAFRPYKPVAILPTNNTNSVKQSHRDNIKPTQLKLSNHHLFQPLILPSESNSMYASQENIFSPIDLDFKMNTAEFHNHESVVQPAVNPPIASHRKQWSSSNQIHQVPETPKKQCLDLIGKSNSLHGSSGLYKKSKLPQTVDLVQSALVANNNYDDRQTLMIADFALSLRKVDKFVFEEAIKQRFSHISWSNQILDLLYTTVNEVDNGDYDITTIGNSSTSRDKIDSNVFSYETETAPTAIVIGVDSNGLEKEVGHNHLNKVNSVDKYPAHPIAPIKQKLNIPAIVPPILPKKSSPKSATLQSKSSLSNSRSKESSDIDTPRDYKYMRIPNKPVKQIVIKESVIPIEKQLEDITFFETIYPATLLYFRSTQMYCNQQNSNVTVDLNVTHKTIKDVLFNFTKLNQSIPLKFRQLMKTTEMVNKCTEKTDKKIKRQFQTSLCDQQLNLESLIMNQIKLELSIVEYYSINVKSVIERIVHQSTANDMNKVNQVETLYPIDSKGCPNIQLIKPQTLVACLFSKGAVNSGLMYEIFLIYREFMQPIELAKTIDDTFVIIGSCETTSDSVLLRARYRLLFILLVWIDGFFCVDFNEELMTYIWKMINSKLTRYMKNVNNLFETIIENTRRSKINALAFQFTPLKKGINHATEFVRGVDIEKCLGEHLEKQDKGKMKLPFTINTKEKSSTLGYQDMFSIIHISASDLALCLTLLQQEMFNDLHPCHFSTYINYLSNKEEAILERIKSNRFSKEKIPSNPFREILINLRFSGCLTLWAIEEIRNLSDDKLQAKIVKKLIECCSFLLYLNNYASFASLQEALQSNRFVNCSFWNHISPKMMKLQKHLILEQSHILKILDNDSSNQSDLQTTIGSVLLSGQPVLPCTQSLLVHLKLSSVGNCVTPNGLLKWSKLKKISQLLDRIRLFKQFQYCTNNETLKRLKQKLSTRIDHLSNIKMSSTINQAY